MKFQALINFKTIFRTNRQEISCLFASHEFSLKSDVPNSLPFRCCILQIGRRKEQKIERRLSILKNGLLFPLCLNSFQVCSFLLVLKGMLYDVRFADNYFSFLFLVSLLRYSPIPLSCSLPLIRKNFQAPKIADRLSGRASPVLTPPPTPSHARGYSTNTTSPSLPQTLRSFTSRFRPPPLSTRSRGRRTISSASLARACMTDQVCDRLLLHQKERRKYFLSQYSLTMLKVCASTAAAPLLSWCLSSMSLAPWARASRR